MDLETWTRITAKKQKIRRILHIRAMVPSLKVGRIVGPRGINHKRLQETHHVHALFSEFLAHGGRLLYVEGEEKDMPNFW